ncbi:MAG: hypothetical protein FWF24_03870 [Alphaproteobacteria bacterium]|nr:hypothetical protein [Alphaproteobacteria bacterium]
MADGIKRFSAQAGIAIGPILFVIALLAILAAVLSAGTGGGFGTAGVADRVTHEVVGQANLIRTKINECHMQYLINGTNFARDPCAHDPYPCSDQIDGTLVEELTCPNDPLTAEGAEQSLWMGPRTATLPPPTQGFGPWLYINAGDRGGRCFWTAPTKGNASVGSVEGLKRAATKFSSQELLYDNTSVKQRFIILITKPTEKADPHCSLP